MRERLSLRMGLVRLKSLHAATAGTALIVCAATAFSLAVLTQAQTPKASSTASQSFDPHDLAGGGVWNVAARGRKTPCSIGGTGAAPLPPDPNCVIPPDPQGFQGFHALPSGVEMTPWAKAKFAINTGGRTEKGDPAARSYRPGTVDDPYEQCDPLGFPRVLLGYIHPFEVVSAPAKVWMIYEEEHMWRLIWTDGRPLPKKEDLPYDPSWLGFSVGHWNGNDFVVDTIGMNDKTWFDQVGHPHSEDLHLTEHYRRVDHDTLNITFTFDDPKAYTKVWTIGPMSYTLKTGPEWEMQESFCTLEDQRNFQKNVRGQIDGIKPNR